MSRQTDSIPVSWRLNAERLVLLGWSRAILLQLAHPLVAAAVAEHSAFRRGPLAPVLRLGHTVRAMLSLTFGDPASRRAALDRINRLHTTINGRLGETIGPFHADTRYSAEDPALLLWVHATLLESIPMVYGRFVRPLSPADLDDWCYEAADTVRALGVRDRPIPLAYAEVERYMASMCASGEIVVSATARGLARRVLWPPGWRLAWPAGRVNRLVAIGLLPAPVRAQYGFRWTAKDARALERWTMIVRGVRSRLPDALALWPEARRGVPLAAAPEDGAQ